MAAGIARPARDQRLDGDPLADPDWPVVALPERLHDAGELVALPARIGGVRVPSVVEVQVAAANPDSFHPQERFSGAGRRLRHLDDLDAVRSHRHRRLHGSLLSVPASTTAAASGLALVAPFDRHHDRDVLQVRHVSVFLSAEVEGNGGSVISAVVPNVGAVARANVERPTPNASASWRSERIRPPGSIPTSRR
jgi:hypothetical protein